MRALGGPSTVGCVFLALSCTPLPPVHRAGSISMMPKGDGKQRRPKKSDLPPPPPEKPRQWPPGRWRWCWGQAQTAQIAGCARLARVAGCVGALHG